MSGLDLLDLTAVRGRKFVFGDNYHHDMADQARPEDSLRTRVAIPNQWKLISWQDEQADLRLCKEQFNSLRPLATYGLEFLT